MHVVWADTMNNKELAERMALLKETESGIREFYGLRAKIFDEGREEGRVEGREEGREEERENLVLSMLRDDLSFKFISKYCGYSEQRIKELRDNFVEKRLLSA